MSKKNQCCKKADNFVIVSVLKRNSLRKDTFSFQGCILCCLSAPCLYSIITEVNQTKPSRMMLKIQPQQVLFAFLWTLVYKMNDFTQPAMHSHTFTGYKGPVCNTKIDCINEENLEEVWSDDDAWWLIDEFHCWVEGGVRVFTAGPLHRLTSFDGCRSTTCGEDIIHWREEHSKQAQRFVIW